MTKTCIFFGGPGVSKEHLWSKALGLEIARWLPKESLKSYKAIQRSDGTEETSVDGHPLYSTTVPCVCAPCNNGWMNQSDERTRNKTIRLIRDQKASFSQQDSEWLAAWLAMKMIVRDEIQTTQSVFTDQEKQDFYSTRLPPADMWIGLGYAKQVMWANAFHRQWRRGYSQDGMFHEAIWTMGLGATVAFIEYPVKGKGPTGIPPNQLVQLWPSPKAFEWPVNPVLTPAQVRYLAMRYNASFPSAGDFGNERRFMPTGKPTQGRPPS